MDINVILSYVPWILLGVLGLAALIALVVGAVKGYTGIKPNALAWSLACGLFVVLIMELKDSGVLTSLPMFETMDPNITDFIVTMVVLCMTAFLLAGVFGIIAVSWKSSFKRAVKKAEARKYAEAMGEEFEIDENAEYHPLPIDGKKKPRIINRTFGALTAAVNAVAVTAAILAIVLVVLYVTPLNEMYLSNLYTTEPMAWIWNVVHTYTLDFLAISFVMYMIRKGWDVGFLEGLRLLIVFVGFIAAVVGPFVLMFTAVTAEGEPLVFLGQGAAWLGNWLSSLTGGQLTAQLGLLIGKIIIAIGLLIVACLLMAVINWLLKKLVDAVDDVKIFSAIEKSLATVLFFVFGLAIVALVVGVGYTLGHYGVFDCSQLFNGYSPIMNALYNACDAWLKPLLEEISNALATVA